MIGSRKKARHPKRILVGEKGCRAMSKIRYRVRNWREYNKALTERFNINLWISEDAVSSWYAEPSGRRGAPRIYSDEAIRCCLAVRVLLHLPLRGCEGFIRSILSLLGLPWLMTPDYATLCRRGKTLDVVLPRVRRGGRIFLLVDSSGLKIYGEGEWKARTHGVGKRRTWRKLHIAVDADTGEIVSGVLTGADAHDSEVLPGMLSGLGEPLGAVVGDGSYDTHDDYAAISNAGARAVIPPRRGAKTWKRWRRGDLPHARDDTVRYIRKHGVGRWKEESGYNRRSLVENSFFRIKTIFWERLRSREFDNQKTEARLRLFILNRMTKVGMPEAYPATN